LGGIVSEYKYNGHMAGGSTIGGKTGSNGRM
jgi:hypothetical protein